MAGGAKAKSVADANEADYARIRKILSSGFSEGALREPEPLLQRYIDVLMKKLQDEADSPSVNMAKFFNYTLIDLRRSVPRRMLFTKVGSRLT